MKGQWIRRLIMTLLFMAGSSVIASQLSRITVLDQKPLTLGFVQSGNPGRQVFVLQRPERVVVDLQDTSTHINLAALARKAPLIQKVRKGHPRTNLLRLVFETKEPVDIKIAPWSQGWKLILIPKNHPSHAQAIQPPPSANRNVVIVLDPGHGGKDPGAIGRRHSNEKHIVLAIAKKLQSMINKQPGMRAVLTRKGDYYLGLRERMRIARRHDADLFVAIHADAFENRRSHGASIFALSQRGATSEAARWLATKENYSELGGVNLDELDDSNDVIRSVLIDLSQTATIGASLQVGHQVLNRLDHITTLHSDKVEQARFMVLKSPDIPSVLIETGFISNPREEKNLTNPRYQTRLCEAIMTGIKKYFWEYPPHGSKIEAMVNQHRSTQQARNARSKHRPAG
ncbi:MAG: N-acetylmuramoyl-L-alanine amidase [Gammaproteobacteria bacterium]|nr:N-acetylmuramoyl-L-alanine amidase [Gammaproteobacteria bacterium]